MFKKLDNWLGYNIFQPVANYIWLKKGISGKELFMRCEVYAIIGFIVAFSVIVWFGESAFIVVIYFAFRKLFALKKKLKEKTSTELARESASTYSDFHGKMLFLRMYSLIIFILAMGFYIYFKDPFYGLFSVALFFFFCSAYFIACAPMENEEEEEPHL